MQVRCPCCGHTYEMRLGVALSPTKARLFDAIRRAGQDGIHTVHLIDDLQLPFSTTTLRVHVSQINDKLSHTGWRIVGRARWGYRLVREDAEAA